MYNHKDIQIIKETYPEGTRIELIFMDDKRAPAPGSKGFVTHVDDAGQIHMKWDSGGSLALILGVDQFKKII